MPDDSRFLVYGAYGYTGRLVAEEALERGHDVVLAGRDEIKTRDLADELDLPYRTFEVSLAANQLDGIDLVLNCAGPFDRTADPLVEACLETETHYLDITGELPVFERVKRRSDEAEAAGVTLLPGVGFDVVPTDCLAAHLKARLPDATHLSLAIESDSTVSPGTLKTALGGMTGGGAVRQDGELRWVPVAHKTRAVDFGDGLHRAVTIPWGDVSTAHFTTGIPNVEVYLSLPAGARRALAATNYLGGALDSTVGQSLLNRLVDRYVEGPDEEQRTTGEARVWGEVRSSRDRLVSRLRTPETYELTVQAALACVEKTLGGEAPTGYQTPAAAFGPDLVLELPGVERIDLKDGEVVARETGPDRETPAATADSGPGADGTDGADAADDPDLGAEAGAADGEDHPVEASAADPGDGEDDDAPSPRAVSDDTSPAIRRRGDASGTTDGEDE
ncbi:saccharopine dehydrogenase family protein [Halogeometricum luteum]|uniref:Saccharopine dehydrogenase NADP-binding domain-containing protein n=1 Tax=Halogeometricum luteum TaxID=2950537 RepID=A0ABU2G0X2_9EURY|nr:saccharopine dehydrogenase NADP-binding domain-containing protein [Halogeometricum sp. S3BR5-2]MDS0294431.1 saccharopine dehydrogenase NADP-binding domain-containing protein [Halogeometricum sp. S3BR5-2]